MRDELVLINICLYEHCLLNFYFYFYELSVFNVLPTLWLYRQWLSEVLLEMLSDPVADGLRDKWGSTTPWNGRSYGCGQSMKAWADPMKSSEVTLRCTQGARRNTTAKPGLCVKALQRAPNFFFKLLDQNDVVLVQAISNFFNDLASKRRRFEPGF